MDREKGTIFHNSTSLQQTSIRVILAIATIFGFHILSTDITQAYIQSATKLMPDIYILSTKQFELAPNQLLKFLRHLYVLTESGEYWNYTFSEHMKKDLGMIRAVGDLSLLLKRFNEKLAGLAGTYVDDSMLLGNKKFLDSARATAERFESEENTLDHFVFAGQEISTMD
ncbi:Retrovirus-related Pol polyprotein from transposon TNT 1-94 [Gracilariopsis chorda]|uniref:Retrovirus-related Pol polyprotein from transposon TNT 1-94 n=1 Tax=Gracilariopsis chorda TaxID=448386 RepID=A0A2V3IYL5_9FLOR|nr:Retrovirus-related Pol polyprotein from transposon TNT 1-94 [Gracilariopsis chorda]|eukprot:PXF47153.1 Retrovirus-related Pol polyprotein from transposon TNT 1-94 [Gracilariopsis chorda]